MKDLNHKEEKTFSVEGKNRLLGKNFNHFTDNFRSLIVPTMLFASSLIMAFACLGHLMRR